MTGAGPGAISRSPQGAFSKGLTQMNQPLLLQKYQNHKYCDDISLFIGRTAESILQYTSQAGRRRIGPEQRSTVLSIGDRRHLHHYYVGDERRPRLNRVISVRHFLAVGSNQYGSKLYSRLRRECSSISVFFAEYNSAASFFFSETAFSSQIRKNSPRLIKGSAQKPTRKYLKASRLRKG